jgi:phosphoribosylformimino-5-aminoimidazole carboxamide ribotide isomerase
VEVIVTSYLFPEAKLSMEKLAEVLAAVGGDRRQLVIDLSCKRAGERWVVAMNKWQTLTDTEVNQGEQPLWPARRRLGPCVDG